MLTQILSQRIYNPQIIDPIQNFTGVQYLQRLYPILIILGFIICVVVFMLIIIIGGIQWITSGGDRSAIDSARRKVINGITGLVILLLVFFVLTAIGRIFGVNLLGAYKIQSNMILPMPTSVPGSPSPTSPVYSDQEICLDQGGTWREFPTSCADNCVQSSCRDILTWACDCGAPRCWLGGNCVANPVSPDASVAPTMPIIPSPTSIPIPTAVPTLRPTNTPTPRPTNTPIPTSTPIPTPTVCPLPARVMGQTPVGITPCGLTSLTFAWNSVSGATQYAIRVDENPVSWTGTCSTINPGDTCIDNLFVTSYTRAVVPGRTYRWWVDAINSCGWSLNAVQYNITVPVCPTNTPVPPTATPIPTPTLIPPTATPTPIALLCNDSDGGQNYYQKGTVTDNTSLPGGILSYATDYCIAVNTLNEYFCDGAIRSQITDHCISLMGAVCFNGECCGWVNQGCVLDSDCCVNFACQSGKCVSPTILLNEAFNMSCRNYCMDVGFSGCISIGTDVLASNGMAYIYPGSVCTLTNTYTCDTVVYGSSLGLCGGYQAEWTRCKCAPAASSS